MWSRWFRRWRIRGREPPEPPITALAASLGVLITGRIGGGKSTVLRDIVRGLSQQDVAIAITCIKPDEADVFEAMLANPKRLTAHVWNPFWEQMKHPGGAANLARMCEDLGEVLTRADSQKQETFWKGGANETMQMAFELAYLVKGEQASFIDVYQIIQSAPHDLESAKSKDFRSTACGQFINALGNRSPEAAAPYRDFFMQRFASIGDKASGAWKAQAINSIRPFVQGPITKLINGQPTITTEEILKCNTIWDLDMLTYGVSGLAYQLLLSWSCMEEVLKRKGEFGYFCLVRDEYTALAHAERDSRANQVGRSLKYIPIVAYQNQPLLEAALGGGVEAQTQAKAIWGLYVNKYFCCQNCSVTAELQSETIGKQKEMFFGMNMNQTKPQDLAWYDVLGVGQSPSFTFNQQWHYIVAPTTFFHLRTGGEENDFLVDAIVHRGRDGYEFVTVSQR